MSIRNTILGVAALAALGLAAPAAAQDYSLEPNYGWLYLQSGFLPDPIVIPLSSGGNIDVSRTVGGHCRGYISGAPDFRLNYDAGSFPLIISAVSDADTTLVINTPEAGWVCDDDSGGDLNPSVVFEAPMSGQYDIWVGTYGSPTVEPAVLSFSEILNY